MLEGEVTTIVGQDRSSLEPGGCLFMPRGTPHGFRVGSEAAARILLVCTPGGEFDRFIAEAAEPATAPGFPAPAPPDIERLTLLATRYGMRVLGPLPA